MEVEFERVPIWEEFWGIPGIFARVANMGLIGACVSEMTEGRVESQMSKVEWVGRISRIDLGTVKHGED